MVATSAGRSRASCGVAATPGRVLAGEAEGIVGSRKPRPPAADRCGRWSEHPKRVPLRLSSQKTAALDLNWGLSPTAPPSSSGNMKRGRPHARSGGLLDSHRDRRMEARRAPDRRDARKVAHECRSDPQVGQPSRFCH
jgi:hypothetical protein